MRGSPHLHALILTSDCPDLTNDTKEAYIDKHVQAYLPDRETDPELYDWVKPTRHIIIVKPAESTRTLHVDLISDNFLQRKQLLLIHYLKT